MTWSSNRRRARQVFKQRYELVEWMDRMNDLAPCPTPDCVEARQSFRDAYAGKAVAPQHPSTFVWAKLNAYGILLSGLALMSALDLWNPRGTNLARMIDGVPPGQTFWASGFVIAGVMLMVGFLRGERLAETVGLSVLNLALFAQTIVTLSILGFSDYSVSRIFVFAIIAACSAARVAALWPKTATVITIPSRDGLVPPETDDVDIE